MRHTPAFLLLAALAPGQTQSADPTGFEGAAPAFRIVVHTQLQGTAIRRGELRAIFLKKATRWPDGTPIDAVDQSMRSDVRARFSEQVLGDSTMALLYYWKQELASGGERPPRVKGSDAEVLAFVAATPGAIGYVSGQVPIPEGVRQIAVVE